MLAKDLLSDTVPCLRTSDSANKALQWMEVFRISHLPIVNNKELLGVISDTDIYDLNTSDEPIGNHELSLSKPYVLDNQHIYEVLELISKLKLTMVPVLNEKHEYNGLIVLQDIVREFANLSSLQNPGGIIVLELNVHDYTLSQIANIVESNDAKILSLYVSSADNADELNLTLKLNKTDLSDVLATFERFGYKVKASFMQDKDVDSFYSERYESFLRYLNT
jgi:acetoin utilization protein AcuB